MQRPYTVPNAQPIQVYPTGLQSALTIFNTGTNTVFLSDSNANNTGWPLAVGAFLTWKENTPLYAYASDGAPGSILVSDSNNVTSQSTVNVGGPVGVNNSYEYLGTYQFNDPATVGPYDLSQYASVVLVLISAAGSNFYLSMGWANNTNYYGGGDSCFWSPDASYGVFIFDVKARYLRLFPTYAGAGNPMVLVYASATKLDPTYTSQTGLIFNNRAVASMPGVPGAATVGPIPLSSRAGRAHVVARGVNAGTQVWIQNADSGGSPVAAQWYNETGPIQGTDFIASNESLAVYYTSTGVQPAFFVQVVYEQ